MKKLLILALVALVAGAAFATTDPAFSGDFEYNTMMDFEGKEYIADDNDGEAAVNLNGVVDEWSTVNAEFSADAGDPITLNTFTLTTDVTGALGVDGPVGVSITWGLVSHEAEEYQGVAGYEDVSLTRETVSVVGLKVSISLVEKVTILALLAPGTYIDDTWTSSTAYSDAVGAVEVQFAGLVEGLDANIFFVYDPNPQGADTVGMELGLTAGYVMGDLSVGLAVGYRDAGTEVIGGGISAAYTIADMLTAGVAFRVPDFSAFDASEVGINLTWMAADILDVFGAAFFDFTGGWGFDAGIIFDLGATSYTLGYAMGGSDFQSPATTASGDGAFFKVSASF